MRFVHRIVLRANRAQQRELEALGVKLGKAAPSLPGEGDPLFAFEVDEEHPNWPRLRDLFQQWRVTSFPRTEFSQRELDSASWLEVGAWHHGYPQPKELDFGYLQATYDLEDWCDRCGIGKKQKAPFQMKREPKWGRNGIMQLIWIYDELFVTPDVWSGVFKPYGVRCRPVTNTRKVELETVVQLVFEEEVGLVAAGLPGERCGKCGRMKYLPVARGPFPALAEEPSQSIARTREYFGSGGQAAQGLLISQGLAAALGAAAVRGALLTPVHGSVRVGRRQDRRDHRAQGHESEPSLLGGRRRRIQTKRELLEEYDLGRLAEVLARFEKRAIALCPSGRSGRAPARSKLGGLPLLPPRFDWPRSTERSLDFLLQVDLSEVSPLDPTAALPSSGLLTIFYDLANQPWGYDPARLDGFRVELVADELLVPHDVPDPELKLPEQGITFSPAMTLPHFGSRSYEQLERQADLSNDEADNYSELVEAYEFQYYPSGSALHRMFGHSANVQDDMQLEAQLVSNGLYCGDTSGFEDPRAKALEAGSDDWILLLQVDSDDGNGLMWGNEGMLYYWIRLDDLLARRFDRVWMTLQCG